MNNYSVLHGPGLRLPERAGPVETGPLPSLVGGTIAYYIIQLCNLPNAKPRYKASLSHFCTNHLSYFEDSTFIRVFGYEESTRTILEVRGIVILRFRRHLMMTLQNLVKRG